MLKLLLVDDETNVLSALRRSLRGEGLEILTAGDGPSARKLLADHDVGVIICDQRMPGITGAELLAESCRLRPDAIRIALTGNADLASVQDAVNRGGISHFLLKPWDDAQLRAVVRESARMFLTERENRQLQDELRQHRDQLARWNEQLELRVQQRTAELQQSYEDTLKALVCALDTREQATAGHSRRVAMYCLYLALRMGIDDGRLEDLYRGALLHDIGKIGIPDAVLLKPGKLDADERRVIETHVSLGARLLESVLHLRDAMNIPRYHHERYDGRGYDYGLQGEEIPIDARLFAIVDVYDALRSDRPYKAAMSHAEAIALIRREGGRQFDPRVTSEFVAIDEHIWQRLAVESERLERFEHVLNACQEVRESEPCAA